MQAGQLTSATTGRAALLFTILPFITIFAAQVKSSLVF